MALFLYNSVSSTEKSSEQERFDALCEAIERSAVQCYAIEGYYPPDIEYLKEHYGLIVDEDKYVVDYSAFASNIMPDVTVFKK